MATKNLVLRTVYIDPQVDDALRDEAFVGRTSKNDLFRKYLMLGMQAAKSASATALTKSAGHPVPAAKKSGGSIKVKATAKAAAKRAGATAKAG
jgi:hypothetical protein